MLPIDPRLYLRAFEDLHQLAGAAVRIVDDVHDVAEVARRLDGLEARVASAEATLAEAVEIARGLLAMDARAAEVLETVQILNTSAVTLAAAVEPLQGVTERLGRIADRLPGGRRTA